MAVTGKLVYRALSLHHHGSRHSCTTDMESLFYSLMDVASGGRALPWQALPVEHEVFCVKYATVHDQETWEKALGKCNVQLRPLIGRLRDVICRDHCTADEYLAAFE